MTTLLLIMAAGFALFVAMLVTFYLMFHICNMLVTGLFVLVPLLAKLTVIALAVLGAWVVFQ